MVEDRAFIGARTCAGIINLGDPFAPVLAGTISGVGGRLAMDDFGLLYSTARSVFGGTDPMGGVRTAALGNVTIVEGTNPGVVVVGEGPRAVEAFRIKYRVIPSSYEVETAKIEMRIGEVTASTLEDVPLAGGRGELLLNLGYTFPRVDSVVARPRLVVNDGTPERLTGPAKMLKTSPVKVDLVWGEPDSELPAGIELKDEAIAADFPEIGVRAISEEWGRRSREATTEAPAETRIVSWAAGSTPARMRQATTDSASGVFESTLETGTTAGLESDVVASIGNIVLCRSDIAAVEPGFAAPTRVSLTAALAAIPHDGASEVEIVLEARDASGNAVADGTPIVWEERVEGELVDALPTTFEGRATARFRAGAHQPGNSLVRAYVDEQQATTIVQQEAVTVTVVAPQQIPLNQGAFDFEIRAASSAGVISDNAPLSVIATVGRVEIIQPLSGGVAYGRWTAVAGMSWRARIVVVANIGVWKGAAGVRWEGIAAEPSPNVFATASLTPIAPPALATISPMIISGSRTDDGAAPFELPDGTFEQVFVKAQATYQITGLTPGEPVTLKLGSIRHPNVAPVAHYSGDDDIVNGVLADEAGSHPAHATGGIVPEPAGYFGQALRLDGTALIEVAHHANFQFAGDFMVQLAVKPPPGVTSQTLLDKSGDYRLSIVEEVALSEPASR